MHLCVLTYTLCTYDSSCKIFLLDFSKTTNKILTRFILKYCILPLSIHFAFDPRRIHLLASASEKMYSPVRLACQRSHDMSTAFALQ